LLHAAVAAWERYNLHAPLDPTVCLPNWMPSQNTWAGKQANTLLGRQTIGAGSKAIILAGSSTNTLLGEATLFFNRRTEFSLTEKCVAWPCVHRSSGSWKLHHTLKRSLHHLEVPPDDAGRKKPGQKENCGDGDGAGQVASVLKTSTHMKRIAKGHPIQSIQQYGVREVVQVQYI
jgi:hypothetical protein